MTLQEKHQDQINKYGCLAANVIAIVSLFIAALTLLQSVSIGLVLRCFVCIAVIIVNTVARKVLKYDEKFKHFCCISIVFLYVFSLATAGAPRMYAIMFPIAILVMIFRDGKLVTIGCTVAAIGTLVFLITLAVKGVASVDEVIIGVIFAAVVCILAVLVTKVQIRQNNETMQEVQAANEIQLATSNEIVKLANDLNQKFVSAKEVADALNESMQTSHNSVYEIAESTRSNAEAIENQTNQTSDIQVSIQGVGDEAKNMGAISENTSATVDEGVKLIERLKEQAFEVAKINNETKNTTQQLNESILDVQAITDTILGISSQTNLLALNASIEAARAGEAGKGFAVVADEIRNLADETRQATEKISQIIARLTQDAESAAASMTQSAEYAEKQNELIEETGEKLMDIKKDTDTLYAGVVQVNESVENIIQANVIIMDSITNLSATGQEVAASSETAISISDSTMEALADMNKLLQNISEISNNMEAVARQ